MPDSLPGLQYPVPACQAVPSDSESPVSHWQPSDPVVTCTLERFPASQAFSSRAHQQDEEGRETGNSGIADGSHDVTERPLES